MSQFHTNKKHIGDRFWDIIKLIIVAILCIVCYRGGQKSIERDALDNGHAVIKDEAFRWQPIRMIKNVKED
ncbi:MAG: hypothetical protein V3U78_05390 [Thiotrichaceae bacterium]